MGVFDFILIVYCSFMNLAGLITAAVDKRKAKLRKWRVPEKRFLLYAALGGGPGVLLGFLAFRHKTRHGGLVAGVFLLSALFYGTVTAVRFLLS